MDGPIPLVTPEELERALTHEWVVLYKHSSRCWLSARAARQIQRFLEEHPDVPVYKIDVVSHPDLSNAVVSAVGVHHESPQAILLNRGRVVWHDSHSGVKASALARTRGEG